MTEIIRTQGPSHKYLLAPLAQHLVGMKLHDLLPDRLGQILLLPKRQGAQTFWYSEEKIDFQKLSLFSDLPEHQKSYVSNLIEELQSAIREVSVDIPELVKKRDKICQVPSQDRILWVDTSDQGPLVFIYEWGYTNKERGQRVDVFQKIVKKSHPSFPVSLICRDTEGMPLREEQVTISYLGYEKTFDLNEEGPAYVGKYPRGARLQVKFTEAQQYYQTSIEVRSDQKLYELTISNTADLKVRVIDHDGRPVDAIHLHYDYGDNNDHTLEVINGEAHLSELEVGQTIKIKNKKTEVIAKHQLQKGENTLEVQLQEPNSQNYHFKIRDNKGHYLTGLSASVMQNNIQTPLEESENGVYSTSKSGFDSGRNAELQINDGGKNIKKEFVFERDQYLYEFSIRRRSYSWLWLLLLIPLFILLLFPFERQLDVLVTGEDDIQLVDATVSLNYYSFALYDFDSGQFFKARSFQKQQTTGSNGITQFSSLPFTLVDLITNPVKKVNLKVLPKGVCYLENEKKVALFNFWRDATLRASANSETLVVEVRDPISSKPIPKADVSFTYKGERQSGISNIHGKVEFQDIELCAPILETEASKEGYIDDHKPKFFLSDYMDEESTVKLYLTSPLQCDTLFTGGHKGGLFYLYLPDPNRAYDLLYDFKDIPDRLVLYKGKGTEGEQLEDTGWQGDNQIRRIRIRPNAFCSGCKNITGVVEGSEDEGTFWSLVLSCD